MKTIYERVDIPLAGGGTAGHVAALEAGCEGGRASIIEEGGH